MGGHARVPEDAAVVIRPRASVAACPNPLNPDSWYNAPLPTEVPVGRAFRYGLMGSALLLLCLSSAASAQYFGRNKVQYDRDRVLVLATDHFDIYYSQEDAAAAM